MHDFAIHQDPKAVASRGEKVVRRTTVKVGRITEKDKGITLIISHNYWDNGSGAQVSNAGSEMRLTAEEAESLAIALLFYSRGLDREV